jgi:hypothetical protein
MHDLWNNWNRLCYVVTEQLKHPKQLLFETTLGLVLWTANVFNPPPLASMNQRQKVARIVLVASTLFLVCLVAAILCSFALVLVGGVRAVMSEPTALAGAEIILIGALGNVVCWRTLLAVARGEHHA